MKKPEKHIIFNGQKFTRDEHTGYYLKTTKPRTRLHIEYYNKCKVPKGCQIHHKDFDKSNNDISNLECVTRVEHNKIHSDSSKWTDEQMAKAREMMNHARKYASEWHKSEEGREWHRKQWENSLGNHIKEKIKKKCEVCGKLFEAINNGRNRFCSNRCKSAYRRLSGIDNVKCICIGCGKTYTCNKYHAEKQKYCSRRCADKFRGKKKE